MKSIDMSAFVGRDFDCEFAETPGKYGKTGHLRKLIHGVARPFEMYNGYRQRYCRPRLNKPQVLDSWDWVPDGFVWLTSYTKIGDGCPTHRNADTETLKDIAFYVGDRIHWVSCIGVEPEYKEWGEQHGMPVVEI